MTPSQTEQQQVHTINMAPETSLPVQDAASLLLQQQHQQQQLIQQPVMLPPGGQHDVTTIQTFGNLMGMWQ